MVRNVCPDVTSRDLLPKVCDLLQLLSMGELLPSPSASVVGVAALEHGHSSSQLLTAYNVEDGHGVVYIFSCAHRKRPNIILVLSTQ